MICMIYFNKYLNSNAQGNTVYNVVITTGALGNIFKIICQYNDQAKT